VDRGPVAKPHAPQRPISRARFYKLLHVDEELCGTSICIGTTCL